MQTYNCYQFYFKTDSRTKLFDQSEKSNFKTILLLFIVTIFTSI